MSDVIQGRPLIKLGPTADALVDYTCWISEFVINETRSTVVKAPSFGSPSIEEKAAADAATVSISFLAVPSTTSGLWWELNRAKATRTGELYFEWRGEDATVSSSNPRVTGYIVVSGLGTGAPLGPRRQSLTFPARSISGPLAT